MEEKKDRIYCGSGKEVGQYGQISIGVCLTDIPKEHMTKAKNGKFYVNLKVSKKKQADQFGKTHSVEVDTWKPEPKDGARNV